MLQDMHARAIFHRLCGTDPNKNTWKVLSDRERTRYRIMANTEMLNRLAPHLHP